MVRIGVNADARRIDGNLKTLAADLEYFSQIGFACVEIPVHGLEVVRNASLIPAVMREVKELLSAFNFRYSVHAPNPLNLMSLDDHETHLSLFQACLEFTGEIQSKVLVYHAGRYVPEEQFQARCSPPLTPYAREKMLDVEVECLSRLAVQLRNSPVSICIENARPYIDCRDYCYGESLHKASEVVRLINSDRIGVTLDIGHAFLAAKVYGFPLMDEVLEVAPLVKHMHIHDNGQGRYASAHWMGESAVLRYNLSASRLLRHANQRGKAAVHGQLE
ncbi:MAG: hypothetical protein DDT37_01150 [Firmicutes bacterium]|nr:hypothetical protein [candidate division NPL-UPA2 bacterium]